MVKLRPADATPVVRGFNYVTTYKVHNTSAYKFNNSSANPQCNLSLSYFNTELKLVVM